VDLYDLFRPLAAFMLQCGQLSQDLLPLFFRIGLADSKFIDTAAQMSWKNNCFFLILAILACFPIAPALGKLLTRMGSHSPAVSKLNAILSVAIPPLLVFVSLLALVGNSYNPFLYFQF
jgi:alginate O-acetyltransferase complex protein AlgI